MSERDPRCVERWPECEPGAHDPRCCRFPKSCSCNVLADAAARAQELDERADELVEYGNSLPEGVTTEAFAEAALLRFQARRLRESTALVPVPVNLAERALTSAKAAELTAETRAKIAAAIEAPADERESLVIDALALAVAALDALTALVLADRREPAPSFHPASASSAETREQALALAIAWADGRRSWINVVHAETPERRLEVAAVMDTQEVLKWSALAQVLPSDGGR